MVTGNFKLALDSIKSSKWRSFLTMLGIIIGVVSVVTIVSIGEGVKKQISDQINHFGSDLITIRPGKPVSRDDSGRISGINFMTIQNGSALSERDVKVVSETQGMKLSVPLSYVSATPTADSRKMESASVFGTTHDLPSALNQEIEYGEFFEDGTQKNVAIIGTRVAENLFQERVPIGRTMEIRGQPFVVLGVFEEFETVSITATMDYNSAVFIPLPAAKKLLNGQAYIQQILAKPDSPSQADNVAKDLRSRLLNAHSGQDDFTILQQEDNLAIANSILNLLTGLITGVAAISLIVGGIGIMNIMIVSVTERTQEIGLRKAVGATNRQILGQFMIESVMISLVGGLIGVVVSLIVNFILRIVTNLEPLVSPPIMALAVIVSVMVGVVFGVAPALKAARKDPIDALRRI